MLFSCKTNMKDVDAIGNRNNMPEMSGGEHGVILFRLCVVEV